MKITTLKTPRFLSNLEPFILKPGNLKHQLKNIAGQSKNIIYKSSSTKNSSMSGKDMKHLDSCCDSSNESLLIGKMSDGQPRGSGASEQVPKGFLVVYVGPELRRFVIPMSCLSMPDFRALMDKVAEEYGFEQKGALELPCDEEHFQQILLRCSPPTIKKKNSRRI
ncbi:hypothetical protein UlMin_041629 [Ulmus minor]